MVANNRTSSAQFSLLGDMTEIASFLSTSFKGFTRMLGRCTIRCGLDVAVRGLKMGRFCLLVLHAAG